MSDDNKNLNDDLDDLIGDAKESAKNTGDKISQKASEFAENAKESGNEFTSGAQQVIDNKKVLTGVIAIIFGALGVHKFILGYNTEGGIMLGLFVVGVILSCVGIGLLLVWVLGLIGLIEGIIYLTKTDAEFYATYQVGKKAWF